MAQVERQSYSSFSLANLNREGLPLRWTNVWSTSHQLQQRRRGPDRNQAMRVLLESFPPCRFHRPPDELFECHPSLDATAAEAIGNALRRPLDHCIRMNQADDHMAENAHHKLALLTHLGDKMTVFMSKKQGKAPRCKYPAADIVNMFCAS
eukprot:7799367-Pyramimonas_sp.AAC.1